MTNQQILAGDWNAIKGKLLERWGQVTDSDLTEIRGDVDQLVGLIRRKTGEGREMIEAYLQQMSGSTASAAETAQLCAACCRGRAAYGQADCRPDAPAITKRNASSAIGRESRCLCVSGWV